ncbi:hypothetical protein SRB17_06800 [Streptomyces sp. RB17]|uniref:DUF397 domain-containing protein n=1 Tax=Streptomyces sp. RB17 TaxID=2585197 RepID=UPI00130ADAEB|nr:DUF397 domain-containing protein [Streptomyces sp. RB17]MQY32726.1 hypothetical protein [Streptomyces sp. RB17]
MPAFEYRKSSYSDHEEECVEVATNIPTIIAIRDSKNAIGPALRVPPIAWRTFQTALASGRLRRALGSV